MKPISKATLKKQERRKLKKEAKEAYARWREMVIDHDNHSCQMCGKYFKLIHVHHIIPRQYKELKTNIANGICLCARCHHWDKDAAHQNSISFSMWLEKNRPDQFHYLKNWLISKQAMGSAQPQSI